MEWLPRIGVECVVVVVVKSDCLRSDFRANSYSDSVAVLLTLNQGQAPEVLFSSSSITITPL
jgi:hypothetical protein